MSAIDADKPADAIVSDIKAHVDKFRQLTAEETQHFFSSLDGQGRQLLVQLLAERAGEPTDAIEENEVFLGKTPSSPPHAGDPQSQKSKSQQLLVMESPSCRLTTTRGLEFRPSRGATFLHAGRTTVMRFVFLGLGSVIVATLFVNFYSRLQANISQSDVLKLSRPNPTQLPTTTLPPTRETTSPHVLPAVQTQSEVEAKPAAQVPVKVEPAVQAPPEVPSGGGEGRARCWCGESPGLVHEEAKSSPASSSIDRTTLDARCGFVHHTLILRDENPRGAGRSTT